MDGWMDALPFVAMKVFRQMLGYHSSNQGIKYQGGPRINEYQEQGKELITAKSM